MTTQPFEGGCTCRAVRYRFDVSPMIVHCCHCRWCQRETGSAFVINAVVETSALKVTGSPDMVLTPSESGRGQNIARCPTCRVAVWSHYSSPALAYVRVGTLDEPDRVPPDVHIFTQSKQPWVQLPADARAFAEFYEPETTWTPETRARFQAARNAG